MNQELLITGEQLVGKGIRMAADYVDTSMQKGTAKLIERPSTWINAVAGFGGLLLAAKGGAGMSQASKQAALIIGSNILAEKIPDYAVELLAPTQTTLTKTSYGKMGTTTIRPTITIQPNKSYASVSPNNASAGFF